MNPLTLFDMIWKQAAICGLCDAYGGMEHQRVFRAYVTAGAPKNVLLFIVEHANTGSCSSTDEADPASVFSIKVPTAEEKQP